MNLVDANVLLYAVNADAQHHEESRSWLDGALSGDATVGFSWIVLLAFLRLTTKRGLFPTPMTMPTALAQVTAWTTAPSAIIVDPTTRHLDILTRVLGDAHLSGNIANDAHLAALAIEHNATVITYDSDFGRFDAVRWSPPRPR
ncbi:MAG TPA: type II toxin-antitoxin system VapC family toxin [Microthrixaceae bacterium]|nr:type II toxin-antitoxin system VapC family toxin [Microthrixaceae bacterium]